MLRGRSPLEKSADLFSQLPHINLSGRDRFRDKAVGNARAEKGRVEPCELSDFAH